MLKKFLLTIFFLILSSCSNTKKENISAEILYKDATEYYKSHNYFTAIKKLDEIEDDFPYSEYAAKADLFKAFIHFELDEYNEAYAVSEKFIKLRPANQYVSYLYYLKSEALYKQIRDKFTTLSTH